jgi:hypothetical protein
VTERVPLVAREPDHIPDEVQLVAFVDDHVMVVLWPAVIEVGFAERVTVGTGVTTGAAVAVIVTEATLLVPPGPVQVIE